MSSEHLESSQNQNKKGDKWTNLHTGFHAVSGFTGSFYLVGNVVDLFGSFPAVVLGLSLPAIIIGVCGAVFMAVCDTYNHRQLNICHQKEDSEKKAAEVKTAPGSTSPIDHPQPQPLRQASPSSSGELSKLQYVALSGGFICIISELAAPPIFASNLAGADELPYYIQVSIVAIVLIFAALASVAEARTIKNAIEEVNKKSTDFTDIYETPALAAA